MGSKVFHKISINKIYGANLPNSTIYWSVKNK